MLKSDSIKELATALAKFQGMMKPVIKDASNPFFKSKYASLSNVIEDTKEPLVKCGLSYAQFPDELDGLTTILMHTSGEWMQATSTMTPVDRKPQSLGSAISYHRRYGLCSVLGLQVDDDDGQEASKPKPKYDTTPIEDDAAVAVSGSDDINEIVPSKKPAKATAKKYTTFDEKKRIIKDLVDTMALTMLDSKEEYESYVKSNTGLELSAPHFDEIILRLKALAK